MNLTKSQIELMKIIRRAPLERWLMDRTEIKDAEKLVKMGLLWKGTAITKQGNRQYVLSDKGEEYLEEIGEGMKLTERYLSKFSEAQGFGDLEGYGSFEEFEKAMKSIGAKQIAKAMDKGLPYGYFPSEWKWASKDAWGKEIPYPGILAKALVQSSASESITDLANIYYAGRKLSKEAIEIFKADALKHKGTIGDGYKLSDMLSDSEGLNNLADLATGDAAFFKKWIMVSASDDDIEKIKKYEPEVAKKLGL